MNTGRRERSQPLFLALCLLLSLGALLGTASILQAQERTTGTITGELKDASGGVLPGATVVITNSATGRAYTLVTDGAGVYRADVEPGIYTVRFEMSSFARQEVPNVEVTLARTFTVNATLRVGNMTEAVQVNAEATPLVSKGSTDITHTVTTEELDRMPKARSFQGIALTAPSVNQGEIEGGFQVNGASGAENAFMVDGVITNSLINGASRENTVFEYIQEVQVKTTGIPAEYGGALGGVISAVTKSGGNVLHGEGHYYLQGSALSGSPVKRLVLSPTDDKTVSFVQDAKQPSSQNEPGASIGGPIVHDHLWYFGSYSPRFNRNTNKYLYRSGAETGPDIKRTQTVTQAFGKLSYGSKRLNAYGTGLYTPTTDTGTLPAYNGEGPNFISSSAAGNAVNLKRGYKITQTNTTGNADIILSNSSFATVRGGYFYDNYADSGIPTLTSYTYQTTSASSPVPVPAALQGGVGTQNTPRATINNFDKTKRAFFNADFNQNFNAAGYHTLKGGVGYQKTSNDVNKAYPGGFVYVYFGSSSPYTNPPSSGAAGYYEVDNQGTIGKAGSSITSLFVQDEWQATDRLTVNLGVRAEHETVPAFRGGVKNAFDFGFGQKVAPRVGAAFDVMGDGKIKAFASAGLYYDWTKFQIARGSFGGDVWCIYYRGLDDPSVIPTLSLSNMPGKDLWSTPGSCRDRRVPSLNSIDPKIKPMSQLSTNAGVDWQVNPRSVLAVHFVRNNIRHIIEDIGFVDATGNEGYLIGNPAEGQATIQFPYTSTPLGQPVPKATRTYDALQISLDRRFAGNWYASANYTYSRLYGNYAGLAASDEIRTPTTGVTAAVDQQQAGSIARAGGNVNRYYDIDELLWDAHGHNGNYGLLATDRPHVIKLAGSYTAPFGTTFGAFQYAGSGTPISTYLNTKNQTEVFVNGRGDMGRTPFLTQTDVLVQHNVHMSNSKMLRVELNVLNVFNQKTVRHLFNYYNRGAGVAQPGSAADLSKVNLLVGYDYKALVAATPDASTPRGAIDPRYGMADLFNPPLVANVMLKFMF
jgi:hypothetical protein